MSTPEPSTPVFETPSPSNKRPIEDEVPGTPKKRSLRDADNEESATDTADAMATAEVVAADILQAEEPTEIVTPEDHALELALHGDTKLWNCPPATVATMTEFALNPHTSDLELEIRHRNVQSARATLGAIQGILRAINTLECVFPPECKESVQLFKDAAEHAIEHAKETYTFLLAHRLKHADAPCAYSPHNFPPPDGIPPLAPPSDARARATEFPEDTTQVFSGALMHRVQQDMKLFELVAAGKEEDARKEFTEEDVARAKFYIQRHNTYFF